MMSDCFTDGGHASEPEQSCDESVGDVWSDSVRAKEVQTQQFTFSSLDE